jgi:hypothetical protein
MKKLSLNQPLQQHLGFSLWVFLLNVFKQSFFNLLATYKNVHIEDSSNQFYWRLNWSFIFCSQ